MSWAVKSGTTERRWVADGSGLLPGEVLYGGPVPRPRVPDVDPLVWDAGLGNVRPLTAAEWAVYTDPAYPLKRTVALAKGHVDDPAGTPVVLAAGGADLAMISNINEVRALVNKLKAAINALSPGAVPDGDLAIIDPLGAGPSYVKGAIDQLAGQ